MTDRWLQPVTGQADLALMSPDAPLPIVSATLAAVHRRDHVHTGDCCHPHEVEIVNLGRSAVAICHDCGFTYGFEPEHDCLDAARHHRVATER